MTQTRIVNGMADLHRAQGVVVVLDIFRASNTILALLAAGAGEVWLLADLAEARARKAAQPRMLLLGERGGVMPPDFDGDNSPARAGDLSLAGGRVILTTSAGTQAVHRLAGAQAVFFGSFANAGALARAINSLDPPLVSLLPMGHQAVEPAQEDDEAARYLEARLAGQEPDFAPIRERLLACEGAERLRRLGQDDDLVFCTTLDSLQVVPVVSFEEYPVARAWAAKSQAR